MEMEITYNRKDIQKLLKRYYERNMGIERIKVIFEAQKTNEYNGYKMEYKAIATGIKVTGQKKTSDITNYIEIGITSDDLKGILDELLKSDGYSIKELSYNASLKYGFFDAYDEEGIPSFDGVTVAVDKINELEAKGRVKK